VNGVASMARTDDYPYIRDVRARPGEILERISEVRKKATEAGVPLTEYLEQEDPSIDYGPSMPLNAFERLLMVRGIRVSSIPSRGLWADKFEKFGSGDTHEERVQAAELCNEYISNVWRAVLHRQPQSRVTFGSDDLPLNSALRPYYDAAGLRAQQIQSAIPLAEILANTTTIDRDAYRTAYLVEPAATQLRMVRVGEGADIPKTRIETRDQAVYLHKYGRAIEITYEAIRRQPIDRVALLIARIAIQADVDKLATAIDALVNGDGNNNAATVINLTTLDPTTVANQMTLPAWIAFIQAFPNPYALTTILGQATATTALMVLDVGTANTMLAQVRSQLGIGGLRPINPELGGEIAVGTTLDAPSGKLVGFDRRFALEQLVEANADINETMRWIINQTETLTISEVVGFDIMDPAATKIANLNA
jgi:hypothetical protein